LNWYRPSVGLNLGENRGDLLVPALAPAILDGMRDVFACTKCHSIYGITRLQQQPVLPPRCQVCFASFPPSELGDWLAYERAEPEWTVGEWLAGQTRTYLYGPAVCCKPDVSDGGIGLAHLYPAHE
jgi:hypothetical protein